MSTSEKTRYSFTALTKHQTQLLNAARNESVSYMYFIHATFKESDIWDGADNSGSNVLVGFDSYEDANRFLNERGLNYEIVPIKKEYDVLDRDEMGRFLAEKTV